MPLSIDQFNAASPTEAVALLDGVYEHSPWIAEKALAARPFRSLQHLKHSMARVVNDADADAQSAAQCARRWPSLA